MRKGKVAESLAEKLQHYVDEIQEGERDNFYDDHIVDELLEMREELVYDFRSINTVTVIDNH